MEVREQPVPLGGSHVRRSWRWSIRCRGSWAWAFCRWPFPLGCCDQLVHDDGIAKRLPEHCVQMGHGGDGERCRHGSRWPAGRGRAGHGGRPDGLDGQVADARRRVEPDAGPVVGQGARLDLHRVSFDPVVQVRRHGNPVPVDVLAVPGPYPSLVPCGLGVLFGGEAADPSGFADARLGVLDADHVGPGSATFHDAIAEPGRIVRSVAGIRRQSFRRAAWKRIPPEL